MSQFTAPRVSFEDLIPPKRMPGKLQPAPQGNPFEQEPQGRTANEQNFMPEQQEVILKARARQHKAEASRQAFTPEQKEALQNASARLKTTETQSLNPFTHELERRGAAGMFDDLIPPPVPDGMVYNPETGQYVDAAAIAERQNQGFWGQMATAGATAMEGVPVLGAYMRDAAGMGDPVQREIAERRLDQFAEERPKTTTGLQIAGGVSAIAPAVAAAPVAFGAGGGGLLTNTALSGASGTVIGAVDSAARSGGDTKETIEGAALGGGLGLLGPVAALGVGKIGRGVGQLFKGSTGRARSGADELIGRALERDGLSIDDAVDRMRELGPEALPADIAPNLRQQAEGLASIQGTAQKTVRDALASRGAGAGKRITGALDEALGQPVNTLQTADDIIAQRSAAATPLYEAARSKPMPFSRDLESLLNRPAMQQALAQAQKLAANEGMVSKQWFANVAGDGATFMRNVPDVRQLDYTKRALDDMIDSVGPWTNEGRVLTGLKNELTRIVDDAVPEYAQARQAFAGPSGVINAMESGKSVFKNRQTPEEIRRTLVGMGEAEKDAFLQGARAAVADIMGTARNDANAAKALFERGYNREKLALLIGDEQAAQLLSRLRAERTFSETANQVVGNSRTAPRQDVIRELGTDPIGPGVIKSALNMNFGDAAANAISRVARSFKAPGIDRRNAALAEALMKRAEFMQAGTRIRNVSPPPVETDRVLRALMLTGGVNR